MSDLEFGCETINLNWHCVFLFLPQWNKNRFRRRPSLTGSTLSWQRWAKSFKSVLSESRYVNGIGCNVIILDGKSGHKDITMIGQSHFIDTTILTSSKTGNCSSSYKKWIIIIYGITQKYIGSVYLPHHNCMITKSLQNVYILYPQLTY